MPPEGEQFGTSGMAGNIQRREASLYRGKLRHDGAVSPRTLARVIAREFPSRQRLTSTRDRLDFTAFSKVIEELLNCNGEPSASN